jgi:AcrR family transcriptional regulator
LVPVIIQIVTLVDSPESPEAGLRERKKAKTRLALRDAALRLFVEQGFERTTVEQIAEACEVSPRTFFRYFATKEDVLFADSAEKLDVFVSALAARPPDEPPLRSLKFAALTTVAAYDEDQREWLKSRSEIIAATPTLRARGSERQDTWNDAAIQLLARRHRGSSRSTVPPLEIRLVVAASSAALRAAMQTWVDDPKTKLVTLVESAYARLAAGFDN